MKVTPLDLRHQQFKTTMRGYDRAEVTALLADAADDYESALRENERLRQELGKAEALIAEHRSQEKALADTVLTALRVADEIRDNAQQESTRIVREAEGRAEAMLQKSQARVEETQREIDGLRVKRREVESSLEAIVAALHDAIQVVRDQDARHRDDKVLIHRPRTADQPAETPAPAARPAS